MTAVRPSGKEEGCLRFSHIHYVIEPKESGLSFEKGQSCVSRASESASLQWFEDGAFFLPCSCGEILSAQNLFSKLRPGALKSAGICLQRTMWVNLTVCGVCTICNNLFFFVAIISSKIPQILSTLYFPVSCIVVKFGYEM